jgi:hypothetical protein
MREGIILATIPITSRIGGMFINAPYKILRKVSFSAFIHKNIHMILLMEHIVTRIMDARQMRGTEIDD